MRNVRREESFEQVFRRFAETAHPTSGKPVFATYRDFLCFLAVLGFDQGERTPLAGKTLELDGRVFDTHEQSKDLVYLIALAGTRDANILHPEREDEMVQVFEEYISTGLRRLEQWTILCADDHIGDQAILTALRREGFFGKGGSSLEQAIEQVEF